MKQEAIIYCGIDVSKEHLDAFLGGEIIRFANTSKGVKKLCRQAGGVYYVFESTGGYERPAAWFLLENGQWASIVNPSRVRNYAKGLGQFAKTDRIDARMITLYAQAVHPRKTVLPSNEQRRLTLLVERRQQLNGMLNAESNRLDTLGDYALCRMVEKHCRWMKKEIQTVEQKIADTVNQDSEMHQKAQRIESIKGLGNVSSATILAILPEIGTLSRREVAALAGVAPYNYDSGNYQGRRHVSGGRKRLRACLYMAAVCASQNNPQMKIFYKRLVEENHRPAKVALTAVMRKLLIAANSAIKNPEFPIAI
jgi:transposase